jgi:hypothetical protein
VIQKPVLIFPAGMQLSLTYLQKCKAQGREVIGSSSLSYDPVRGLYPRWASLPYVNDPVFDEALKLLVFEFDIGEIYTPNFGVWNYLNQVIGQLIPGVTLVNTSPVDEVLNGYRIALTKARYFNLNPLPLTSHVNPRNNLSEIEVAALIRYADLIPGMCDDDKLRALLDATRYSVKGDIVEIGSWWGKSAFILCRLAHSFDIGQLLCVDPWSNEHLIQHEKVVDSASAQVDADEAFDVFQIGLLPFSANRMNYLRMTSLDASLYYGQCKKINTAAFGLTEYSGQISILHIDGNHMYNAVKVDVEAWVKFVVAGGWIILDDYIWPYGDGPKRVGDEFLERNRLRVATAFVMGTALFIQLTA